LPANHLGGQASFLTNCTVNGTIYLFENGPEPVDLRRISRLNALVKNKKITTAFFCFLIVLAVCLKVFTFRAGVLDELWPYDLSRAITEGIIPYKDYPIVSMPLFSFIFAIPLLISKTLFAYRVMAALFFSVMLVAMYFLIEKRTSAGYALCAALFAARFVELATYNMLIMFEALLIVCCLRLKNRKTACFLTGLLAALAPLTKQSSGSILLLLVTGLIIWSAVKNKDKKIIGIYLAGVVIPLVIFLIYLICTSSFYAFWDCCFFGLFSFGGENAAIRLEGTLPMAAIVIAGIAGDIYFWVKKRDEESLFHLLTGIAVVSNAVPIFEYYHIVMGGLFFLIPVTYLIREFAPKIIHINIAPVIAVMILGIIGFFSFEVISDPRLSDKWDELKLIPSVAEFDHLEPLINAKNKLESEGKNVTVFSSSSVVLAVLDGYCDPPYDMFLKGNLGTKDPLDYAKEACGDSNNVIFIASDYNEENLQNPDGILEYVQSHCDPIGSFENWIIYCPKTT
jgi:hypothetical protein